jgi:hypothetical protein
MQWSIALDFERPHDARYNAKSRSSVLLQLTFSEILSIWVVLPFLPPRVLPLKY